MCVCVRLCICAAMYVCARVYSSVLWCMLGLLSLKKLASKQTGQYSVIRIAMTTGHACPRIPSGGKKIITGRVPEGRLISLPVNEEKSYKMFVKGRNLKKQKQQTWAGY